MRKRNGKRMLCLLLAAVLAVVFAGCGPAAPDEAVSSGKPAGSTAEATASPTPDASAEPQKADGEAFYTYLRETVIPEEGLASLEKLTLDTDGKEDGLAQQGGLGLLSADVRDYDGDGEEDMVTLSLVERPMGETSLGALMYEAETNCLAMEMRLYTCDAEGAVALSDTVAAVAVLEHYSWGPMLAGVQESDGVPYLYGFCAMVDPTTYGAAPFVVYHVEDGKFVFDMIGGRIGWGQGTYTEDANAVLGTRGMRLIDTPLNDVYNVTQKLQVDGPDAEESNGETLRALDGSLMAYVGMYGLDYPETATSQAQDATQLREILERGLETIRAERTPAPSPTPALESEYAEIEAAIATLIEEVESASGIPLELVNEEIADGTYTVRYEAAERSSATIAYDTESGAITSFGVYANGGEVTEEWIALKDAALAAPSLGLDADAVAPFLGDCGFQNPGVEAGGGANLIVGNAGTCTMLLQWL